MTSPIRTLSLFLLLTATSAYAQPGNAPQRYIEVTGSADAYLTPTIYYYMITVNITEKYDINDYDQRDRKATQADQEAAKQKNAALLKQVKDILQQQGVGEQAYIQNKYDVEITDEPAPIVVKINDAKQLAALSAKLADSKICRAEVVGVYNPAIDELKETLRATAFKNAKDQATKLLAASGDKLGAVLQIRDRATRSSDEASPVETNAFSYGNRRYNNAEPATYSVIPKIDEAVNKRISVSQTLVVRFAIE